MVTQGVPSRRLAAIAALVLAAAFVVLAGVAAAKLLPWGLLGVSLLVGAVVAGWQGLMRRGASRVLLWVLAGSMVVGSVAVHIARGWNVAGLAALAVLALLVVAARHAFSVHLALEPAAPPRRAVVVWNPQSGGGKASVHDVAGEARKRGIEPIELHEGDDLATLVRGAVADGADGLMAAGGDGTQALVAAIAAEHGLPFACIPAGTRNHFALDLGVDRDDVVGALDAFVDGGEKRVDLGEVSGRVFVNNVSLGVYAEAVQKATYRDAKLRTLLETAPEVLGSDRTGSRAPLHWSGPDGRDETTAAVILVSNNPYRLGVKLGSGTRPRMDGGVLGLAVAHPGSSAGGRRQLFTEWTAHEFVVRSDGMVPVGVDGEALRLPSPVVLRSRPGALRVRIAAQHPGASPSYALPTGIADGARRAVRIAAGTDPRQA